MKSLGKLPLQVRRRIDARNLALADEPRPTGSMKLSGQQSLYRIRIGDYRVVYHVDDEERHVRITAIAHRREVYRDL